MTVGANFVKQFLGSLLCAAFLLTPTASCSVTLDSYPARSQTLSSVPRGGDECIEESTISRAVQTLSDQSDESGIQILRNAAKESAQCRLSVINAVIKALDKPNLDFDRDQASFWLWRVGSIFLVELKADESIDLLISHLGSQSSKFSVTMTQQPAVGALIGLGPVALPKLVEVLKTNSDANMRRYAVYCIAQIGGRSARRALEDAMSTESDACVQLFLRTSVKYMDSNTGQLSRGPEWLLTFWCQLSDK